MRDPATAMVSQRGAGGRVVTGASADLSSLETVRVTRLSTTAIKGTQMTHPRHIELRRYGAMGDRALFIVDAENRLLSLSRTGSFAALRAEMRTGLRLCDSTGLICEGPIVLGEVINTDYYGEKLVRGHVVEGPWAAVLSERAGRPVRLVKAARPGLGIDDAPVTLLGSASIERLAEALGEPVDARRFRMLIELATDRPHAEDDWRGGQLVGKQIALQVGAPVPRCAAVTRNPDSGGRDQSLVRAIRSYRGVQQLSGGPGVPFGVYGRVLREGSLRVGESLRLVR